ncbi:hypothetical protein TcarDRAFT_2060 [Thermosinus carboxydivorans Nor1]|uniref:DUF4911 domain-containing protein n=1 Tax=Thermosinus carboxydivorans Nor1 TaxID=401526 RepID=A1HMV6_9FIRM|nr:DUF4911 domain-containing protein [Thermosinus carboxydivorans]EAX48588.1 hypothetical protein TcarDRAFT_2060 [Thermosinus carboxydivorans Nor1]
MSRRYKGTSRFANTARKYEQDSNDIDIKLKACDINLFIRLLEGYENIVMIIPLEPKEGLVKLRPSPDTGDDVREILKTLPIEFEILG